MTFKLNWQLILLALIREAEPVAVILPVVVIRPVEVILRTLVISPVVPRTNEPPVIEPAIFKEPEPVVVILLVVVIMPEAVIPPDVRIELVDVAVIIKLLEVMALLL